MKVILDDRALDVSPASVADALIAGRDAAEAEGRLVIEVHADGEPMASEMLDAPPEDSDAGIGELRLVSTRPGPFIRTTLHDAAELLEQVRADQAEAVASFQSGRIEQGVEPLQRALASWTLVRDVVEKVSLLGAIEPGAVEVPVQGGGAKPGSEFIEGLVAELEQVRRALELHDFSALADVLEGELDAQAVAWTGLLSALAERLSQE